jgi:hypothetical protein
MGGETRKTTIPFFETWKHVLMRRIVWKPGAMQLNREESHEI